MLDCLVSALKSTISRTPSLFWFLVAVLQALTACLSSSYCMGQSLSSTLQVSADAQTKVYGTADPVFTFQYAGFTGGVTASILSGQPALSAPQRVQNLWQYTENPSASSYSSYQFQGDGTSRQWNGIQLSHVLSSGSFYSELYSSISALPSPIVVPGMQYLFSFYAVSNIPGSQLYWHRYLLNGSAPGWGPTAIDSNTRRVLFSCVGTAAQTLDCGNDPTIPLGSGAGGDDIFWLYTSANNAFGAASNPGLPTSVAADLYLGGFQIEPAVTEKRGVVVMGDSLTQYDCGSTDVPGCTSWTDQAASLLNVPFYNRGVGGQTCAQILARWPTDAHPILVANAAYAIIFCGTNDIGAGFSDSQIEQTISAMSSLAIADGAIPVVATVGPFALSVANDTLEATRQSVNAWIRATYPMVLDFDAVNADPSNPRQQNPLYVGDSTHLNLAGRIAEGNYVAQSVAGNTQGFPSIWSFHTPIPYQPVLSANPSNGMDFSADTRREVGTYIILPSAGTLTSPKYQFSFSSALLSVTPAPLQVTANDKTITYGDALPGLDGTLSGALAADGITAQFSTTATASSSPGQYPISPALADPQSRLSNYSVTQKPGTLTILAAHCAAPAFSVPAGTYRVRQSVSIVDGTPGAIIYYTIDGSLPTSNSTVYSGAITVSSTETLQAISVAPGYLTSTIATAVYTILPPPAIKTLTPPSTSAGGSGFTLVVNGSGFDATTAVSWQGNSLATQYVSPTSVSAQIPASALARSGIAAVTVQSTAAGAPQSNTFQFEVDSSDGPSFAPVFKTVAATVAAGRPATYAVALPSVASNVTVSCLNLPAGATCSYSASTGTLTIDPSSITPTGAYQIVVVFTETVPGAASAWFFCPIFLMLLAGSKNRRSARFLALFIFLGVGTIAITALVGCGGRNSLGTSIPASHQIISSGTITLTVQ
jgi:lysophospholipase L1-like esterase